MILKKFIPFRAIHERQYNTWTSCQRYLNTCKNWLKNKKMKKKVCCHPKCEKKFFDGITKPELFLSIHYTHLS